MKPKRKRPARSSKKSKTEKYLMRLYVTGATPRSTRAITNLRRICDENLDGNYELEVIDIYQQPTLARESQIIAAPTLIKTLPLPLRKFIGDMSDTQTILAGLEILAVPPPHPTRPLDGRSRRQ